MAKRGLPGPRGPKERRARTPEGARGAPSGPGGPGRRLLAMSHEPRVEYNAKNKQKLQLIERQGR